ncbi:hypothetical protein HHL11_31575 [Ramlibacter sp. G-1-2-2]|uniref:Uncharacterized protein n=1 Tax=Ramlibacter agri TaxID=2728837 RepID=A0A848HG72_9BURK|nr:hypothetical protein [Ramlibacter agri]NML48331.1 hypothetical protein [Ramlibacter agri]
MSDLSTLDQSFALPSAGPIALLGDLPPLESTDVQAHEVTFRHLRTPVEITRILHLRDEIRLPQSAREDLAFSTREKKETRWAWSAPSCVSVRT